MLKILGNFIGLVFSFITQVGLLKLAFVLLSVAITYRQLFAAALFCRVVGYSVAFAMWIILPKEYTPGLGQALGIK